MSAENKDTEGTEEVLGDKAPVLEPAKIAPLDPEPVDPFEDSISLTATSPVSLSQLRQEIAESASVPGESIELAYVCKDPDSPVSAENQATVFIKVHDHKVTKKALEGALNKHVPADTPVSSSKPLEGEVAALADRLREGDDTLSTKELSSVLGAMLA